jgi:formate dehydrogenase major subunit
LAAWSITSSTKRWNNEQFFQDFLVHYTNAPMLISDEFQDTEDLDGVFSGLMQYKEKLSEWPYNGFVGEYNNQSWQYAGTQAETQGWTGATARSGEQEVGKNKRRPAEAKRPGLKMVKLKRPPPKARHSSRSCARCSNLRREETKR